MYDDIVLLKEEIKTLRLIKKKGEVLDKDIKYSVLRSLLRNGFITYNRYQEGLEVKISNTVSISNEYLRYKKAQRRKFIERYLPIIFSFVALIVSVLSLYFNYLQILAK